jgi:hypothetical protein
MKALITDSSTGARMSELEHFPQRYLGLRRPEFGVSADELRSIEMPAPLQRFFKFAGRWPGHNPQSPFMNRFCMQDELGSIAGARARRTNGRDRPSYFLVGEHFLVRRARMRPMAKIGTAAKMEWGRGC